MSYYYYYKDKESSFIEELTQILISQNLVDKEKIYVEYQLPIAGDSRLYRADIYLDIESISLKDEDGNITKINGPIVFELKRQLQFDTVSNCLKLHKQLQPCGKYQNFILIYFNKNDFSDNLPEHVSSDLNFYIYDSSKFIKALKKDETGNQLQESYRVENKEIDDKEDEDWKVKRLRILENAKTDFNKKNNISFFLGAGVSIAAGLPGWNTLLERMLHVKNFQEHLNRNDLNKISDHCGSSSIVLGRFIKTYHEIHNQEELSKDRFIDIIREALYKGFNKEFKSPLITQLIELIKTGNIAEIITYNFDNILETCLEKENIENYPVFNNNVPQAGLPIYHVHGFIPMEKGNVAKPMPVLSEEQYHEVYANAYNWGNVEQLHALNRTTCFFIGLSMNDPNLRRILEISHNEAADQTRHYAFLARQQNFDTEKKDKCFQYVQTEIFKNLGLNVIWYNKHEELPVLLSQLI